MGAEAGLGSWVGPTATETRTGVYEVSGRGKLSPEQKIQLNSAYGLFTQDAIARAVREEDTERRLVLAEKVRVAIQAGLDARARAVYWDGQARLAQLELDVLVAKAGHFQAVLK